MNKLRLLTFLLLSAFLIQSCKKDTVMGTAFTTAAFQANVNGSTWGPDSISTAITYIHDVGRASRNNCRS